MPSKASGTLFLLIVSVCGFVVTAHAKNTSDESATISGVIVDDAGLAIRDATVFVYSARLKQGYAIVCPTCWADCGKHAYSDANGRFTIAGLNSALDFRLLVVKDGFIAAAKGGVDPAQGSLSPIKLSPRVPTTDASKIVNGRITDVRGGPIAGALVEPVSVMQGDMTSVGSMDWIDKLAVSNSWGEFAVISAQPVDEVMLKISPRGLAPKLVAATPGPAINFIVLTQGATVMGQLVEPNGTPVADAEIVMTSHYRANGETFGDMRVGTDKDGSFVFTNVPARGIWGVYPTPDSLQNRNLAVGPAWCETTVDGQVVNVGRLKLLPGYSLSGKIDLLDKKHVPSGMHVSMGDEWTGERLSEIGPDGTFGFTKLAPGIYFLTVAISGYAPTADSPRELLVNRDRAHVIIHMARSTSAPLD